MFQTIAGFEYLSILLLHLNSYSRIKKTNV